MIQTGLAIGGVIASIATTIAVVYKLKPERSNIIVTSAETSLRMASGERDDCRAQLAARTRECEAHKREFAEYRRKAEAREAAYRHELAEKDEEIAALRRVRDRRDQGKP
jgi:hypothetical protein